MSVLTWTPFLLFTDRKSLLEKGDAPAQELVNSLQVFETTAASMDTQLHPLVIIFQSSFCMKQFSLFIAAVLSPCFVRFLFRCFSNFAQIVCLFTC